MTRKFVKRSKFFFNFLNLGNKKGGEGRETRIREEINTCILFLSLATCTRRKERREGGREVLFLGYS